MSCISIIPSNEKVGESLATINSNFQCLGTSFDSLSAQVTTLSQASAGWDDTFSVVQANSATWLSAYTTLNAISGTIMTSPIKSNQFIIRTLTPLYNQVITLSPAVDATKALVIPSMHGEATSWTWETTGSSIRMRNNNGAFTYFGCLQVLEFN